MRRRMADGQQERIEYDNYMHHQHAQGYGQYGAAGYSAPSQYQEEPYYAAYDYNRGGGSGYRAHQYSNEASRSDDWRGQQARRGGRGGGGRYSAEEDQYPSRTMGPPPSDTIGYNHTATYHHDRSAYEQSTATNVYERRPYRPRVTLSDGSDGSRDSRAGSISGSSRQYSTGPAGRGERKKKTASTRSKVRASYHQRTFEAPANYPVEVAPPGPLPLLVLDLNGTLVYRDIRKFGNSAERSKAPVLRPYLKSFLQYCLGLQAQREESADDRDCWDEWEASRDQTKDKERPHGSHFWRERSEPKPREGATHQLLLWSSAQPHNVDSMARAILSPEQAEQLLRVYARDTLVAQRLYLQKAPSVKDLEILWTVLNSEHIGPKAEARLLAEARYVEDHQSPDEDSEGEESTRSGAAMKAALKAQDSVVLPKKRRDGNYSSGKGYGQHNTLLLDDSIDKARLQPFNHVLLPEFDREAALRVSDLMKKGDTEAAAEDIDNVLLQMIGVLEHARYQVNVSSWVRFGGLGDFGGVAEQHPYYAEDDEDISAKIDNKLVEQAIQYFSPRQDSKSTDRHLPRLNTPVTDRSQAFWVEEGERALRRHGIPLQKI